MKRISEQNKLRNFSLDLEYGKIEHMLSKNTEIYEKFSKKWLSIEDYVGIRPHFLKWHLRDTFLTIGEMREALTISEDRILEDISEEKLLQFLQYAANCLNYAEGILDTNIDGYEFALMDKHYCTYAIDNIEALMPKLNAELKYNEKL